ncbi:MAG: glycosyltransferase family 4 protein [Leptonema illini]|uniref:Glycosyltransferase family 4 protein n=1 Tax=Leptonema illini TaxID=183 RepID=A0A833H3B5_9LEPT|nr:MAG: glycosyltransferase family 4 protein [Leptonema illini]PKL32375.1 MAG: glycosyl transferase [Spirochaetae bacterium HGW-Spirochaetae-10]
MSSDRITIAVDARPLTHPVSGVSRMISRIIEHLDDGEFEFHLFAPNNWNRDFESVIKQSNVIWNQSHGLLSKKAGLWYNSSLPMILHRMKPAIYWGTQQTVPAFLSSRIPVVLTFHDFVSYRFPGTIRLAARIQQRMLQRRSVRVADCIIANSRQTMREIQSFFGADSTRLKVGYPGVESRLRDRKNDRKAEKKTANALPISIQGPYILSVSTIEPRKNFGLLLEAYLKYHRSEAEKPYSLVLAGRRGWESKEFFARLDQIQQETGSVFVLEGLRDDQLTALYEDASFFCLPSLYEGFGITLLEALSFGKTALVSDLDCFHEIAGEKARYLPAGDVDAWALALKQQVERHRSGSLKDVDFDVAAWSWKETAEIYRAAFKELAS